MDLKSTSRTTLLHRTKQSFENTRIENGTYLSPEHREQIFDNSQIIHLKDLSQPNLIEGVGTFRHIGFVNKQGYAYRAIVGEPLYPGSTLNVPIIGTTAWFTGITRGFNRETASNYLKDGNYYVLVGAEGSYDPPFDIDPISPLSLADSAAAILRFSDEMMRVLHDEGHSVDLHRRIVAGASRGGMVGLGISNLAPLFNQSVIATQVLAPRFPEKLSANDALPFVKQIGGEALRMMTLPISLGASRSRRYIPSFDLNSVSLPRHVEIGGAITSGEAGAFIAGIDRNQYIDLIVLSRDAPHEHDVWQDKLWAHPNSRVRGVNGIHMDIPRKCVQLPLRERIRSVQACTDQSIPLNHENVDHMLLEVSGIKRTIGNRALRIIG